MACFPGSLRARRSWGDLAALADDGVRFWDRRDSRLYCLLVGKRTGENRGRGNVIVIEGSMMWRR
jgi:hypothetical protein